MKQVILEYSNEEVEKENFIESILYDILSSLDVELLKEAFLNKASMKKLHNKYGDKAFLIPEKLQYPIINPETGEKDQGLLHAAYIDLKRKAGITGTGDLAQKARDMMDETAYLVEIGNNRIPLMEYVNIIL